MFNDTSWVDVVTPTDRPTSVHYRCVIEVFGGVFFCCHVDFWIFCWCRGFCHRTESNLFLFILLLYHWELRYDRRLESPNTWHI